MRKALSVWTIPILSFAVATGCTAMNGDIGTKTIDSQKEIRRISPAPSPGTMTAKASSFGYVDLTQLTQDENYDAYYGYSVIHNHLHAVRMTGKTDSKWLALVPAVDRDKVRNIGIVAAKLYKNYALDDTLEKTLWVSYSRKGLYDPGINKFPASVRPEVWVLATAAQELSYRYLAE